MDKSVYFDHVSEKLDACSLLMGKIRSLAIFSVQKHAIKTQCWVEGFHLVLVVPANDVTIGAASCREDHLFAL